MTGDSITPEQPPSEALSAPQSDEPPAVGPSRGSGDASEPQTGVQRFVPGWAPHMDAYAKNSPAPVPSPAGVRDQIAAAIRDAACDGDCGKTEDECARERIQPFAWHHGKLAVVEGSPEQFADAVLREPAIAEALADAKRADEVIGELNEKNINLARQAAVAKAAVARVRELAEQWQASVRPGEPHPAADAVLAALDPQEQP